MSVLEENATVISLSKDNVFLACSNFVLNCDSFSVVFITHRAMANVALQQLSHFFFPISPSPQFWIRYLTIVWTFFRMPTSSHTNMKHSNHLAMYPNMRVDSKSRISHRQKAFPTTWLIYPVLSSSWLAWQLLEGERVTIKYLLN